MRKTTTAKKQTATWPPSASRRGHRNRLGHASAYPRRHTRIDEDEDDEAKLIVLMTPDHPRWREFCDRLAGPDGCDFSEDRTWKCAGGTNKDFAAAILEDMGEVNVPLTLSYFESHGGYCDCEILFNVDR
jgi:hypothetical protein